eukprot:Trichotokara_eunicae@DN3382_c0_g1_i2.p1
MTDDETSETELSKISKLENVLGLDTDDGKQKMREALVKDGYDEDLFDFLDEIEIEVKKKNKENEKKIDKSPNKKRKNLEGDVGIFDENETEIDEEIKEKKSEETPKKRKKKTGTKKPKEDKTDIYGIGKSSAYVAPHLRKKKTAEGEFEKDVKGLINKVSEGNMTIM